MELKEWQGKYVLYGSRTAVIFTLIAMLNQYQKIDYVCIDDGEFDGLFMLNRQVISLETLLDMQKECLLIVSPDNFERVSLMFDNIYVYDNFGKEQKILLGTGVAPIKGEYFYHIAQDARRLSKMIIYGTDETARILNDKLRLIDIEIDYFVDDNVENDGDLIGDKKIYSVYDLLYENVSDIMVISTRKDFQNSKTTLTELGLEECRNFRFIQQYEWNYYRWYHWIDPQLGYNIINYGNEKYPGFFVYGSEEVDDFKIAILGGSTADATLYPFKPWTKFLYDMMIQQGFGVTLFVGGNMGYPVETEVIKLMRDVLPLKPNLVIDYSGVNNLVTDSKYPFCNVYQKQFYENASARSRIRPVTYGICHEENNFTEWLSSLRIMRAVCQEFEISFISVLTPLLGAKETEYSSSEKEIILNTIANNPELDYMERGKWFSDSVKKWVHKYHWLYDFSQIFDDYDDVWIDKCHVNERGNEIVAQKMWEILQLVIGNGNKVI